MRVFLGLTEVAGYYAALKRGFMDLGVECTYVNLRQDPFAYTGDVPNRMVRLAQRGARTGAPFLAELWWRGIRIFARTALFAWAIARHDVFVLGYRSHFLTVYDVALLRLLRKKVVCVFHGADARPPYIDGAVVAVNRQGLIGAVVARSRQQKRALKRIERYANVIVSHPLYGHFFEKPFVSFLNLGLACASNGLPEVAAAAKREW